MVSDQRMIDEIRDHSRVIVRELGFMGGNFAGTDLPPSAVHALIEIGQGKLTARKLAELLRLEKSSVSRLLRKLIQSGYVLETSSDQDARLKILSLTAQGEQRLSGIHEHGNAQVASALNQVCEEHRRVLLEGLRVYSGALRAGSLGNQREYNIVAGYQTGLIGRITQLHADYYARESGFGKAFECVVATGLGEFSERLDNPKNGIWSATNGGEIVGCVAIDGEDLGPNIAHLRWFIVDDSARGLGIGRRLLSLALEFVDKHDFHATHLWTFESLIAARRLYESVGFICKEEKLGTQWGMEVKEQRLVRVGPGSG